MQQGTMAIEHALKSMRHAIGSHCHIADNGWQNSLEIDNDRIFGRNCQTSDLKCLELGYWKNIPQHLSSSHLTSIKFLFSLDCGILMNQSAYETCPKTCEVEHWVGRFAHPYLISSACGQTWSDVCLSLRSHSIHPYILCAPSSSRAGVRSIS